MCSSTSSGRPTELKSVEARCRLPSAAWLSRSCATQAPVLDFIGRAQSSFREVDYFLNQSSSNLDDPKIGYERFRCQPWTCWMQAVRQRPRGASVLAMATRKSATSPDSNPRSVVSAEQTKKTKPPKPSKPPKPPSSQSPQRTPQTNCPFNAFKRC